MTSQKPFLGAILLLAVAISAATLTGCAPKQDKPLSMEIALTDEILEPGQDAILTVSIANIGSKALELKAPGPDTVKLYLTVVAEDGTLAAAGTLPVEVDAMGAETEMIAPGESLNSTLAIPAGPAEAGEYRLLALYKCAAGPELLLVNSNVIGVLVE